MTTRSARAALAGAGMTLAAAAVAAVMLVPERAQLVLLIASSGANEVVFPVAYWVAAALWAWLAASVLGAPARPVVARAIGVAATLHVLVLLAAFAVRLAEPATFSTPFYWMYARLFSAAVLAGATWWAVVALRAMSMPAARLALIDLPVGAGALVLAAALLRHDPLMAAIGLVLGGLVAATADAADPLSIVPPPVRRLLASERVFLLVVFCAALLLRLLYLRQVMTNPNYVETGADGPVYDELAWSIARGEGIRQSFTDRFPLLLLGYVWLASGVYAIAGHSYFALCALQAVIGSAACLVLYAIAKDLFGVLIARVSVVFAVISFPLLFAAAAIGHQAIDVFLTLVLVWLLWRAATTAQPAWWTWAAIGALFGLAIAVRETVVFFLAFIILWIPFVFRRRAWRGSPVAIAALLAGVLVLLLPVLAPKVASEQKRLGLRIHFDRLYTGEADPNAIRTEIVGPLSSPAAAARQLVSSPLLVLGTLGRAWGRNIALQFFSQPYGGFDLVFLSKGTPYYYGLWIYVYLLAAAGLIAAWRGAWRPGPRAMGLALIVGVVLSRTFPHVVLESNYRHRVPIEPFLILVTAAAVVALVVSARGQSEAMIGEAPWR
ncbi:MAG: glycosyltransferase family 39 protein [Vicinamibacterales bacterium]